MVAVLEQRGALNETLSSILIVQLYVIRCHTDSNRHRAKEDMTSKPLRHSEEHYSQHVNKLISLPFLSLRSLKQFFFFFFHFRLSDNGSVVNAVRLSWTCPKEI